MQNKIVVAITVAAALAAPAFLSAPKPAQIRIFVGSETAR